MKPETIDPLDPSAAGVLLMNAMGAAAQGTNFGDLFIAPYRSNPDNAGKPVRVQVVLTVNGVQVPYMETVNESWKALDAKLATMIEERAYELCTAAGLDELMNSIQRAEWDIKDALQRASQKFNQG
jgi:hypothetical protein